MSRQIHHRPNPLAHRPGQSIILRLALAAVLLLISASGAPPPQGIPQPPAAAIKISEDQAISAALNQLAASPEGFILENPRFQAQFTAGGVSFALPGEGLDWQWSLAYLGAEGGAATAPQAVRPIEREHGVVAYSRLGWEERYLPGSETLEQQFVLHQPLPLGGRDLLIAGRVQSQGEFQEVEDGWLWVSGESSVWMSGVGVYDALGTDIPATMEAWREGTRILVDGRALEQAVYPVTVDPEIGPGDFRISNMGDYYPPGWYSFALAYNSGQNEYLVAYMRRVTLGDDEYEIYARRLNGVNGEPIGGEVRLSDMGPDGDSNYGASFPAVVYNATRNEYLVVWHGDDDNGSLVDEEFEIYSQRVSGINGQPVGANDVRLSDMGPDGDINYVAEFSDVIWNGAENEYLVVWKGDDNTSTVNDEFEIFAQRVDGDDGSQIGGDRRVSSMGSINNADYDAFSPAVAWNSFNDQYLVVWFADDWGSDEEDEIYGQRLDGISGDNIGGELRLSDMGPDGDTAYDASAPDVVYNPADNQYLVVWVGDDNSGALVDEECEIFGQLLDYQGGQLEVNDFRISDMGPDGDPDYDASVPSVAYASSLNQYLVIWNSDDNNDMYENIFSQRLSAAGGALGENDLQISQSPDGIFIWTTGVVYNPLQKEYLAAWHQIDVKSIAGQLLDAISGAEEGEDDFGIFSEYQDINYDATDPAVAYDSLNDEYFVVWSADHSNTLLVNNEYEIYGQRVDAVTGLLLGDMLRLSDMGPDGDASYDALNPAVAFNDVYEQFYVVWEGDDDTGSLVNDEYEIWGQRVEAFTGNELGSDVQLCSMGGFGDANYDAANPAVAYSHTSNRYLVVWEADEISGALVNDEIEIWGQLIDASNGSQWGVNDFRISSMGPDGSAAYDATYPAVAWDSGRDRYLVVWQGDHNAGTLVDNEMEIYAMRLDSAGGEMGYGQFRVSDMGPDGNTAYDATYPSVAYGAVYQQYLVVWSGDDNTGGLVDGELEIFGQLVDYIGYEVGIDFRISQVGVNGDTASRAYNPTAAYNPRKKEFLVAWHALFDVSATGTAEYEIYGQRLNGTTGAQVGINDFRLSDMGPNGDALYWAYGPAAACQGTELVCLVVWYGTDNRVPLIANEQEVFGQLYSLADTIYLPRLAK